jgi:hypothetical protein
VRHTHANPWATCTSRRRAAPPRAELQGRELDDPGTISTSFLAKVPGPTAQLGPARFTLDYQTTLSTRPRADGRERPTHDKDLRFRMWRPERAPAEG